VSKGLLKFLSRSQGESARGLCTSLPGDSSSKTAVQGASSPGNLLVAPPSIGTMLSKRTKRGRGKISKKGVKGHRTVHGASLRKEGGDPSSGRSGRGACPQRRPGQARKEKNLYSEQEQGISCLNEKRRGSSGS